MATSTDQTRDREGLLERVHIVGGSLVASVVLAVGVASFVDGATAGFGVRLPVYLLAGAVVFAGALVAMRYLPQDEMHVLRRATAAGVLGFVGISLGTEAVIYGLVVVAPQLSLYLASVGIVAGGLVYWSARNWRAVDDLTRGW
ncbi:hypothetical protein [Halovenus marina]|uniref:hypothetical protein n=1 Tax=Halovenus marina TaxID=3396621 RepID=UPI003F55807B